MSGGRLRPLVSMLIGLLLVVMLGGCGGRNTMNDGPAGTDAAAEAEQPDVELGPTDTQEVVTFSLSLVLPGEREMRVFLEDLYDPQSPNYRHFLKAPAIGERFGLPLSEIESVVSWLAGNGLEVVLRPPQRTSLTVRGRAADVNRAFGVTLVDWQTAQGVRYHRPQAEARVPDAISSQVAWVVGLDTEPAIEPAIAGIYGAGVPHGGLRPEDVRRAYEIEELHAAGIHGEGQTIAIMSFDTFHPEDVAAFDQEMGIASAPVEPVRILGASSEPGPGIDEVSLDIQVIRGIAPGATILNYEAPNSLANFGVMVGQIVADGRADIISLSWGKCEKYYPPGVIQANEQQYAAAFLAGVSVFVASGDDGAYGCRRVKVNPNDPYERDNSPVVDSPSSSPSMISVGGTFLSVREDGTYYEEAGWEEPLGGTGAGGGLSTIYQRPSWQQGAGVENAFSNGKRQVPDVGGPADGQSGFIVIFTPQGDERGAHTVGGTSAAAPFWAASMVLTRQLAGQSGVDGLGALGPLLYQVAAERPDVFHDVIKGGNLLHQAAPGWDYVTGLGTPRVGPLANAIVDALTR